VLISKRGCLHKRVRLQEPGQPPRITPLSLLRNVTSSGEGQAAWPRDLLEAVMSSISRAERASPASSRLLMSATNLFVYTLMLSWVAQGCRIKGAVCMWQRCGDFSSIAHVMSGLHADQQLQLQLVDHPTVTTAVAAVL
jgi:hypothetical protein